MVVPATTAAAIARGASVTSYAWQFMKYLRSGGDECALPIMKRTDYLPTTSESAVSWARLFTQQN